MTEQVELRGESSIPVRSLLTCRCDSTSTVSTLSFGGSGYFTPNDDQSPTMPGRMSSIPRLAKIDRFKAGGADHGLKVPGRKASVHRLGQISCDPTSTSDSNNSLLPPRRPSRQDTADRKTAFAHANDDRPGLNRVSGGINVFSGDDSSN